MLNTYQLFSCFLQNIKSIYFLSVFFLNCKQVILQFGIPIYPPPILPPLTPILPPPPPMMMAPAMVAILSPATEETTTITKKSIKMYPAFPAFCCSVKKKNVSENIYAVPVPIPPIVAPPPLVLVPVPPVIPTRIPKRKQECNSNSYSSDESDSSSSTSSCSSDYYRSRGYRKKRRRRKYYRRNLRSSQRDNELLKPMLSFVADNGDVKFVTKISNNDVAQLLGKGKGKQKTNKQTLRAQDITKEDESNNINRLSRRNNPVYKKVLSESGVSNYERNNGKKLLIFKSPADKKISNLTVSFNIS